MGKTTYNIEGMHCASCELLVKEEITKLPNVNSVTANASSGKVTVRHSGAKPSVKEVNSVISEFGYKAVVNSTPNESIRSTKNLPYAALLATVIAILFLQLERAATGLYAGAEVSGLLTYFILGVTASISSCAALVGGIILAQSKTWNLSNKGLKFPLIQFHVGRIISFIILGALLGLLGSALRLSLEITVALVIVTSLIMIILGLQMLAIFSKLNKIQLKLPGNLGEKFLATKNNNSNLAPLLIGAGTFLLPCGFTLTAQAQALSSGSLVAGATIMGAFVLGTLPVLAVIGITAKYFTLNKNSSDLFLKTAGLLVILFAVYTINNQLNVLGLISLNNLFS